MGVVIGVPYDPKKARFPRQAIAVLLAFSIILLAILGLGACATTSVTTTNRDLLTVSTYRGEYSTLIYVAETKGYFAEQGLEVRVRDADSGALALKSILAGEADIGTAAEFVLVNSILQGNDAAALTGIGRGNTIQMVARRDRGITTPADLRGKRVAVTIGTQAQYYLALFLNSNRLAITDITVVDLAPVELVKAIVEGRVDAAITWEPNAYEVKKQLGGNAVGWTAQSGHEFYFLALARPSSIARSPGAYEKFLSALARAESFTIGQPDAAKEILQTRLGVSGDYLAYMWPQFRPGIALSQGLVVTMEAELDWGQKNLAGAPKGAIDPLDYISRGTLQKVKPAAVTIVE